LWSSLRHSFKITASPTYAISLGRSEVWNSNWPIYIIASETQSILRNCLASKKKKRKKPKMMNRKKMAVEEEKEEK